MGRFDALTHLEEDKHTSAPLPAVSPLAPKPTSTQPIKTTVDVKNKKPEIMNSVNHDTSPLTESFKDKPSKYSTLLDAALIKKIKLFAAERELKDYEVIELALIEYFNKQNAS